MEEYKFFAKIKVNKRFQLKFIYNNLKYRDRYYIYRGQPNAKWDISSRLEREEEFSLSYLYEYEKFIYNYIGKNNEYEGLSDIEKLAKMQHYGGKTRFIDFTRSFGNALFFALYDPDKKFQNKDFAVWLVLRGEKSDLKINIVPLYHLDRDGFNRDYQEDLEKTNLFYYLIHQEYSMMDIRKEIENLMNNRPEELKKYKIAGLDIISREEYNYYLEHSQNRGFRTISLENLENQLDTEERERIVFIKKRYPENLRMVMQKGLFLFSIDKTNFFMENLCFGENFNSFNKIKKYCKIMDAFSEGANQQRAVIKIIFNNNLRNFTKEFLRNEGITYEKLFPREENLNNTEGFFQSIYDKFLKTHRK